MFVELHARSAFSFLDATPLPEDIAAEAARLEQPAIALVDRDGVYGAPRFYRACTRLGLTPLVGAARPRLLTGLTDADSSGHHVLPF